MHSAKNIFPPGLPLASAATMFHTGLKEALNGYTDSLNTFLVNISYL